MNTGCSLIYFISLIGIAVFSSNIFIHVMSLLLGLCSAVVFKSLKRPLHDILFYISVIIFLMLANPLFVTYGNNALFYIFDRPYTLQAMLRGGETGIILSAGLVWFGILSEIFTSDKVYSLFSRPLFSGFATVFSLTMRWLPSFKSRFSEIKSAQKSLGYTSADTLLQRLKFSSNIFSSLAASSLEMSAQTAQSMKCRGFMLEGHSSFFSKKPSFTDLLTAIFSVITVLSVIFYSIKGKLYSEFYPVFIQNTAILPFILYSFLCFLPILSFLYELYSYQKSIKFSRGSVKNVAFVSRKS